MAQAILTAQRSEIKITKRNANRVREEWIRAVEKLISDIAQWCAEEPGWRVAQSTKEIQEEKLGIYQVPMLKIQTGEHEELTLEPLGRHSWRGEGEILLSVYPTFMQVRLLYHQTTDQWLIRTDSGIDWPFPVSHDVFIDVAKRLVAGP